jgi:hypothetical protein
MYKTILDSLIRKAERILWHVSHKESNYLSVILCLIFSLFYAEGVSGMKKTVQQCHGEH